jgi:predicted GIY-YIG superfamily endonuclease
MKTKQIRAYEGWGVVCIYELQALLPNGKILSYVGQSFDFSERFKEHFFGIKDRNVRNSTSQKFVNYLAANNMNFSQVGLFLHHLERLKKDIDSTLISEKESYFISLRKSDKRYICCNIKD